MSSSITPLDEHEDLKPQISDPLHLFEDDDSEERIDELASSDLDSDSDLKPNQEYFLKLPIDIQTNILNIKPDIPSLGYTAIGIAANWENPISEAGVRNRMLNELNGIDQDGINPVEAASWSTYLNNQYQLRGVQINSHQVLISLINTTSTDQTYHFNGFAMGALVAETFNKVFIILDTINKKNSITFIPGSFVDKDPQSWNIDQAMCIVKLGNGWVAVKLKEDMFALPFVWDKDLVGLEEWRIAFSNRGVWKHGKSWDYNY